MGLEFGCVSGVGGILLGRRFVELVVGEIIFIFFYLREYVLVVCTLSLSFFGCVLEVSFFFMGGSFLCRFFSFRVVCFLFY